MRTNENGLCECSLLATNKLCASDNIEVIVIHQNMLQISLTLWLQTWKDLICCISTEDNSGI